MLAPWEKNYDKPRRHIKKQRQYFANRGPYSQSYGFSSSHVWMLELGHKEGWAPKNWWFRIVVLETFEGPLDCKEIKASILKEISAEYSLEGLMLKLKHQLWPPVRRADSLKRPWCWESSEAREGCDRGWDGYITSPTQWTWIWTNSRR